MPYEDIRTEQEYREAVAYFNQLLQAPADQDHIEMINQLGELIETYEILNGLTSDQ
jgi:hypothetical protein